MPPSPNVLQQAGAKPSHETQGAALFHNRFRAGLVTQRNPLRDPSGVVEERWYGGRGDALLDGVNLELSNLLTLDRAPGSTPYSTATIPQAANSFYSLKQFTTNTEAITLLVDTPSVIYSLNPTSKNAVLTKAAGAGAASFIGAGNVLYIGDGAEQQAWTPLGLSRNWGIAIGSIAGSVTAYAGTGVDSGGGSSAWANPTRIQGPPDVSYATTSVVAPAHTGDVISNFLDAKNYGFAIGATDTILGLQVTVNGTLAGFFCTVIAKLIFQGAVIGTMRSGMVPGGVLTSFTLGFGNTSDGWGAALTPHIVNDPSFGVRLFVSVNNGTAFSATSNMSLDAAQILIYHAGAPNVSLVAGGFSPAPSVGYQYAFSYGNNGQVFSAATQLSGVIKPDATHSVQVGLVASTDPQVNQIWVWRNRDGGSVWQSLPMNPYPNTTANIVDSAPDVTLNSRQLADLTGLNTPPPQGFSAFEFHMGRIWGAVGNTVYYSVGPDLGFILGNGNEGFPPANFFTFPTQVVRLLSIGTIASAVLVVFTLSDVYVIYGNGSAAAAQAGVGVTVFYAGPLLRRVGLANYNALEVRGSVVYMMTNDGRVISFNPSSQIIFTDPEKSINEIGFPIGAPDPRVNQTSLANFAPAASYVTWHGAGSKDQALYVSDGSSGWFRCNPNQQPDGGAVWSTKRNIAGGCSAVQSIETSPGVFQLLIGPPAGGGSVLFRDPNTFSDNGTSYPCNGLIGPLILAHPGQTAAVTFITADFDSVGSQPTLGVLFDEISGAMAATLVKTDNDPPHLPAPVSVFSNRYHTRQSTSGTQIPVTCRWMIIKIDFGNDVQRNRLLTLTPFGSYEQEA